MVLDESFVFALCYERIQNISTYLILMQRCCMLERMHADGQSSSVCLRGVARHWASWEHTRWESQNNTWKLISCPLREHVLTHTYAHHTIHTTYTYTCT